MIFHNIATMSQLLNFLKPNARETLLKEHPCLEKVPGKSAKINCVLCETTFDGSSVSKINDHLSSQKHRGGRPGSVTDILNKYPNDFEVADDKLICLKCFQPLSLSTPKIERHFKSKYHIRGEQLQNQRASARRLSAPEFNLELAEKFAVAGIPFEKLDHPELKGFLEKSFGYQITSASNMRKKTLQTISDRNHEEMLNYLKDKMLYISIDETTNSRTESIASVVVGTLEIEFDAITGARKGKPGKHFLFSVTKMESTKSKDICALFEKTVEALKCKAIFLLFSYF